MRTSVLRVAGGWACLLSGLVLPCHAQEEIELSMDRVVALARERALEPRAAVADVDAAAGGVRAARTPLYNPEVAVGGGPRSGTLGPDVAAEVSWSLEAPGQRGARTAAAESALRGSRAELELARRQAIEAALMAWHEALYARGALALSEQQLERDEALRDLTRARLERGDAARLELQLLEAEVRHDRAAVAKAVGEGEARVQQLLYRLGLPASSRLRLEPSFPPLETPAPEPAVMDRISRHPGLVALREQVEAADARVLEQRRAALPAPTLSAGYAHEEGDDILLFGLALPLPVVNRNRGEIARAKAEALRARALLEARQRELEAEYRAAHAVALAALKATALEEEAVKLSHESLESLVSAWKAGDRSLLEVLAVRREVLAAAREALDSRLEAARAVVKLQALEGGWL